MADFTIYLANKNYSSWSMRAWLMLKQAGAEFDEVVVPLRQAETRTEILRHSPSGRLPALRHGDLTVWESLAIGEYLAEVFTKARLWPATRKARAVTRAISAEMHGGFGPLRRHLPMNMRGSYPGRGMTEEAQADLNRIFALWRDAKKRFGAEGDFLFGEFGIPDAMYAPVIGRLRTYGVPLDPDIADYCVAVETTPHFLEWQAAAKKEPMIIEEYEF